VADRHADRPSPDLILFNELILVLVLVCCRS
jgi:hypothetical protein